MQIRQSFISEGVQTTRPHILLKLLVPGLGIEAGKPVSKSREVRTREL